MIGPSGFNIYFEIASLFILLTIILIYFQQNFIINKAHYIFLWLWFFTLMISVMDIVSVIGMDRGNYVVFQVGNVLYYLAQQWTAYIFFLYVLAPLWRRERASIYRMIGVLIPIVAISILILINIKTGWFYTFDEITHEYSYGSWQYFIYIPALLYYFAGIYYCHSRRDVYNASARHAFFNSIFVMLFFTAVSIYKPLILTRGFAVALAMLQLLIVTVSSHAKQDADTKILNSKAFDEQVTNLIYNKIPFNVVAIRFADYEVMISTYGLETILDLTKKVLMSLKDEIPVNRGYKIAEDCYAIIYENQSDEDNTEAEKRLNEILEANIKFEDMDMSFAHFIVTFRYPDKFTSYEELRSLFVYLSKMHRMRYGIMDVEEFAIRDLSREKDVEQAVNLALTNHDFEMYYQPIFDNNTGKFASSEALIRLNKSAIGFISPAEFIPIAERAGLIIPIGNYVVEDVFRFISENDLDKLGIEYIELNLSTIQCLQRDFVEVITGLAEKYQIDPKKVCFEITETASNCAPEIFLENLTAVHEMGYKLAIDDFGTGYGNLHRLISMEFDIVKFDKETTEQICLDEKLMKVYKRMVNMIHSMGSHIVNEGVETKEQLEYLKSVNSDYIQGYYFSKPVTEKEYVEFCKERNL